MQLVERRADIGVVNLFGGCRHQRGLRFQSVERRNFAGDRAQRSDLHIALFGDLLQARIIVFELIFFGAQLVIAGNLQQHAGIRAGNAGQAEESNGGADHENIQIMNGDGNFAQLAVVPAGHKKDVKAFLQIAPRTTRTKF